jgi:hypothetical protein
VQGLANAPVVGPVIREHMKSLPGMKAARVNNTIKMDCGKVVDTVDIEVKEERLFIVVQRKIKLQAAIVMRLCLQFNHVFDH